MPAKTASVVVSLRASVASGYMYLDDVFCVDVSNEKAIDATSNALSTLNSTVTQQGKDITSNSNSITSLSNQMVNGRQNMWVRSVYNVQLANNTTEPTFSDINGKAPISIDEVPDAAKLDFASVSSYVIAHYKAFVKVNADTTITMAPGSRVFDDTGAVYVNGVRVAFGNASWNTVSFDLKAGWSTVEFLVNQWTGQAYINLGFKLSEKVAQLNSALGMNALSNAISAVTSNVSTVGDRVTSTSQSVTDLRNSLEQTNANLANKADAQALSTLQNTVSQQGDQITSQGNSITKLTNDLATTNNNVSKKADQSALSVLSGRVDQTESGLSSANSSITALNSSVRAGNATSGDLISNPTFDPEFSQMGFTVVSSSSEGVPANCPYAYVARIAARDHHPNFAAIPATLGDVYEMSALVACGTYSADFNLYLGTATRPSGSVGAPLSSGGNRKASATWQRVTWRFKITQGIVDRGFFRPFLQINQSSPFGTVWYVTDWHLRNVTDSSKVQDSLDATAKAVDSLTSTVNQQGRTSQVLVHALPILRTI